MANTELRIKELCKEKGITQAQLADKLGIQPVSFRKLQQEINSALIGLLIQLTLQRWKFLTYLGMIQTLSPALIVEVKYILTENHICRNTRIYEGKNTINKKYGTKRLYKRNTQSNNRCCFRNTRKYKDKHVLICPDDIQSEKENIILTMNLIMNIITERPKYKIQRWTQLFPLPKRR